MESTIQIKCPEELLLGLHMNADDFVDIVKFEVAVSLFKKGQISSGLAAKWLDITRVKFLLKAMDEGATLLDDSKDDLRRELIQL